MKYLSMVIFTVSLPAWAQTIERQPIDIIYGNQVIHTEHQVVVSSKDQVAVIPVDKTRKALAPNVVITSGSKGLSYLEENAIAEREQAIYDEVNKRTEEAPFTVLFTGNIPEEIENRRLRMMPEIGVFGEKANDSESDVNSIKPDVGDFAPIGKDGAPKPAGAPATKEEKLEKLIGG